MMKLSVENFCCYTKREFEFPTVGTVLLTAPSGSGKTSLIRAIIFALYGTGTRVIKFGSKKCTVKLDYLDMRITRTKGPCRLIVDTGEAIIEDKEAQAFIDTKLSKSSLCSLDQTAKTSFVRMNSTEKLAYLEQLATDTNLHDLKATVKETIKAYETRDVVITTEISVYTQLLSGLDIPDIPVPRTKQNLVDLEKAFADQNIKCNTLTRAIHMYSRTLNDNENIRYSLELISQLRDTVMIKQENLIYDGCSLEARETRLNELIVQLDTHTRYEQYKLKLDKYNELKNVYNALTPVSNSNKIREIEERMLAYPDLRTLNGHIKKQEETLRRIGEYKMNCDKLAEYRAQLANIKQTSKDSLRSEQTFLEKLHESTKLANNVVYSCPKCESFLQLYHQKLCAVAVVDKTVLDATIKDLESQLSKISDIRKQIYEFETRITVINRFMETNTDIATKDTLTEQSLLDELVNKQSEVSMLSAMLVEYTRESMDIQERYQTTRSELCGLQKECLVLKSQFINMDDAVTLDGLRSDINAEQNCIKELIANRDMYIALGTEYNKYVCQVTELTSRLKPGFTIDGMRQLNAELDDLKRIVAETEQDLNQVREFQGYITSKQKLDEYTTRLNELQGQKEVNNKYIVASRQLKQIIQEAETKSLLNTISTINMNIQIYLDAFFTTDPITVTISTEKVVKKVVTSSIDLVIKYKDEDIDITTLSGGELSRLVLAFALVISEVNNSQLVILDESLSTLDSENCNNVYDFIKENCGDKLVIVVAHQLITGMFDHIMEL